MSATLPPSNLQVVACWSKAGVGTCIVLEYRQQDQQPNKIGNSNINGKGSRIVLDLGATPCFAEAITSHVVLISHGHLDHIGAIFSHARAISCRKGVVPTYFVPSEIVPLLEDAKRSMCALDRANDGSAGARNESILQMNIVGVNPGDEVLLGLTKGLNGVKLFARVFQVKHAGSPAVGYIIGSRQPPTLRDEIKGKSEQEIRDLVAAGVNIKTDPIDVLEVAYTGDTGIEGLMISKTDTDPNNAFLSQAFSCRTFITEATFLDSTEQSRYLSLLRGHMQVSDVVSALNYHGWNGNELLLIHLSARYSAAGALDRILTALPVELMPKCKVAVSSLMSYSKSSSDDDEDRFQDLIDSNGCIRMYHFEQLSKETQKY